jgi:hypothetical protein
MKRGEKDERCCDHRVELGLLVNFNEFESEPIFFKPIFLFILSGISALF